MTNLQAVPEKLAKLGYEKSFQLGIEDLILDAENGDDITPHALIEKMEQKELGKKT